MVFFTVFLVFSILVPKGDSKPSERIANGLKAHQGQFPFAIALIGDSNHIICGGSLIYLGVILTAAKCNGFIIAIAGRSEIHQSEFELMQFRFTTHKVTHPSFHAESIEYTYCDLALVFVDHPFSLTSDVKPIDICDTFVKEGSTCTNMGWGNMEQDDDSIYLTYQQLTILGIFEFPNKIGAKYLICAGSKTSYMVKGDMGGPLICQGKLYGVGSGQERGSENPGYFANAVKSRVWILSNGTKGKASLNYTQDKHLLKIILFSSAIEILNLLCFVRNLFWCTFGS